MNSKQKPGSKGAGFLVRTKCSDGLAVCAVTRRIALGVGAGFGIGLACLCGLGDLRLQDLFIAFRRYGFGGFF